VTLSFDSFQTECGYDYVRVYDGPSVHSRMLAAISGNRAAAVIRSSREAQGQLTVHWYSDETWVLPGFLARFVVEECPDACNHRGSCVDGLCHCHAAWRGDACEQPVCPEECHEAQGQGTCSPTMGVCICAPGYFGASCAASATERGGWEERLGVLPGARAGHTALYCPDADEFVVYGGRAYADYYADPDGLAWGLDHVPASFFGDVVHLEASSLRTVRVVNGSDSPPGRYFHAAALLKGCRMVVFGGRLAGNALSNALLIYNCSSGEWQQRLQRVGELWPPPVFGHAMAAYGDDVYMVGGRGLEDGVLDSYFVYNMLRDQWQVRTRALALFQKLCSLQYSTP
jgi:hypothetical protein